ncbi:hypothetical protein SISNIDRAFT_553014 [Sistotremastrum niveocremeum HHB9708]|uniref:Uncharacterized protein n=1 Tax=Sistotremastrum niveocremeum HHB9708 TaxID=1314777 RepID=A0A164NLA4_9AGAM|nr:hypothetical protein SISNIDRAFT_553014 [Sistotremastrum niveocremeum HHB9708]
MARMLSTLLAIAVFFNGLTLTLALNSRFCEGASIVKTILIEHPTVPPVNFTTWACPSSAEGVATRSEIPARGLVERQTSQCTEPSVCVCGQKCTNECLSESTNPKSVDCNNLGIAAVQLGGTFFTPANSFSTATSGTCLVAFLNAFSFEIEECFTDFGVAITSLGASCFNKASECVGSGWAIA